MANYLDDDYIDYVETILATLTSDEVYKIFRSCVVTGEEKTSVYQNLSEKIVDEDWLTIIEDSIIPLDEIIRNPRKFIKQTEDIVPVSLARSITTDSVKHLATHTNLIHMSEDGEIRPEKILNITKDESLEVYENRFIITLIKRLKDFIDKRYLIIKESLDNQSKAAISVNAKTQIGGKEFTYKLEMSSTVANEDLMDFSGKEIKDLSGIQRVARISLILDDFIGSSFFQELKNTVPVKPPITRTNVILKDPKFKQCLLLWQFIETYEKVGYIVNTNKKEGEADINLVERIRRNMFLHYVLLKQMDSTSEVMPVIEEEKVVVSEHKSEGTEGKSDGGEKAFSSMRSRLFNTLIDDAVNRGDISEKDLKIILQRMKLKREVISRQEIKEVNDALDRILKQEKLYQEELRLIAERKRKEQEEARAKEKAKKQKAKEAAKRKKQLAKEKALLKAKALKEKQKAKEALAKQKEEEKQRLLKEKALKREEEKQRRLLEKQKQKEEALKQRQLLKEEKQRKIQEEKDRKRRLKEEKQRREDEELQQLIQASKQLKEIDPLEKVVIEKLDSYDQYSRDYDLNQEAEKLIKIDQEVAKEDTDENV